MLFAIQHPSTMDFAAGVYVPSPYQTVFPLQKRKLFHLTAVSISLLRALPFQPLS
jgi:hypothetical protein